VWSPTWTRDQPITATRGQTTSNAGPNTTTSTVAAPAAMAAWTEIFHHRVITQPQATPTAIDACRATIAAGAPNTASRTSPTRMEVMATSPNRIRWARRVMFLSVSRPRRTPPRMSA
jgi:hypothetical protein